MRSMAVLILLTACGGPADDGSLTADDALAEVEAAIEGYEAWSQHADFTGILESGNPDNRPHNIGYVQVWFNDTALDALNAEAASLPVGSIAVKRGYTDAEGTDATRTWAYARLADWTESDWYWAAWEGDGTVVVSGAASACIGCHDNGVDGASLAVTY